MSKVKRSGCKYCCVSGCLNKSRDDRLSYFALPSEPDRLERWLELIDRPDLRDRPDLKPRSHYVCSMHFDESLFKKTIVTQLQPGAEPSKFLPLMLGTSVKPSTIIKDACIQTKEPQGYQVTRLPLARIKNDPGDSIQTRTTYSQTEVPYESIASQTSVSFSSGASHKRKLQRIIQESDNKIIMLQQEIEKLKEGFCAAKPRAIALTDCNDELTKRLYELIHWKNNTKAKGKNHNPQFKFLALNLYFTSPHIYRSLQTTLNLPNESKLHKTKLHVPPKFDDRVIKCLTAKLNSLPEEAKYCTLCVDQMFVKRHLYYNIKNDEVIGLQNVNGNVTEDIASIVYVILLRGIAINWIQPIAYSFLTSTTQYEDIEEWVNDVISKLFNMGIKVMAIVTDQDSNFDKYAKEVKHVTAEKPYFILNQNKIYYIFDVPHLLTRIRNDLCANDFYYDGKRISWSYIALLYRDQKDNKLGLLPKITDEHIKPNNSDMTKIKYATQIFSGTVCAALKTYIFAKYLPQEAKPTAEFFEFINNLFDVLNSSKKNSDNKYKIAFTLNKDQMDVLGAALDIFKTIRTISTTTDFDTTHEIKSFENMRISIHSMILLTNDLKKSGFEFICTRRLNKEPLECFFKAIKKHEDDFSEINPIQFKRAFGKQFLLNMLQNSPSQNCQADLCDMLLRGNTIFNEAVFERDPLELQTSIKLNGEVDYRIDLPKQSALTYVASFLMFKCAKKHKCPDFDAVLRVCPLLHETKIIKNYEALNRKSLFYKRLKAPPATIISYVEELEEMVLENLERNVNTKPANVLLNCLQKVNFEAPCDCFPAEYFLKLFVRLRVYSALKYINRCIRKNRYQTKQQFKVKEL